MFDKQSDENAQKLKSLNNIKKAINSKIVREFGPTDDIKSNKFNQYFLVEIEKIDQILRPQKGWRLKGLLPSTRSQLSYMDSLLLGMLQGAVEEFKEDPKRLGRIFEATINYWAHTIVKQHSQNEEEVKEEEELYQAVEIEVNEHSQVVVNQDALDQLIIELHKLQPNDSVYLAKYGKKIEKEKKHIEAVFKDVTQFYVKLAKGDIKRSYSDRNWRGAFYNGEYHNAVYRNFIKRSGYLLSYMFKIKSGENYYRRFGRYNLQQNIINVIEHLDSFDGERSKQDYTQFSYEFSYVSHFNEFFAGNNKPNFTQIIIKLHNNMNCIQKEHYGILETELKMMADYLADKYFKEVNKDEEGEDRPTMQYVKELLLTGKVTEETVSKLQGFSKKFYINKLKHEAKYLALEFNNKKSHIDRRLENFANSVNRLSESLHVGLFINKRSKKKKEEDDKAWQLSDPFEVMKAQVAIVSEEEKRKRALEKRIGTVTEGVSEALATGEGMVATSGIYTSVLAKSLFIAILGGLGSVYFLPIWIAIAAIVGISGAYCNYYLVKDPFKSILLSLFDGTFFISKKTEQRVGRGYQIAMVVTGMTSVSVGGVYFFLSYTSGVQIWGSLFGLFMANKVAFMVGGIFAFFPAVATGIGLAAIFFVIIGTFIREKQWEDIWEHLKFYYFLDSATWREMTLGEGLAHIANCFLFRLPMLVLAIGLTAIITVFSFGLFYDRGLMLLHAISTANPAEVMAKVLAVFNAINSFGFSAKNIYNVGRTMTMADLFALPFKLALGIPALPLAGVEIILRCAIAWTIGALYSWISKSPNHWGKEKAPKFTGFLLGNLYLGIDYILIPLLCYVVKTPFLLAGLLIFSPLEMAIRGVGYLCGAWDSWSPKWSLSAMTKLFDFFNYLFSPKGCCFDLSGLEYNRFKTRTKQVAARNANQTENNNEEVVVSKVSHSQSSFATMRDVFSTSVQEEISRATNKSMFGILSVVWNTIGQSFLFYTSSGKTMSIPAEAGFSAGPNAAAINADAQADDQSALNEDIEMARKQFVAFDDDEGYFFECHYPQSS